MSAFFSWIGELATNVVANLVVLLLVAVCTAAFRYFRQPANLRRGLSGLGTVAGVTMWALLPAGFFGFAVAMGVTGVLPNILASSVYSAALIISVIFFVFTANGILFLRGFEAAMKWSWLTLLFCLFLNVAYALLNTWAYKKIDWVEPATSAVMLAALVWWSVWSLVRRERQTA